MTLITYLICDCCSVLSKTFSYEHELAINIMHLDINIQIYYSTSKAFLMSHLKGKERNSS